ncbi:glycine cleavage system protein T (plasmid) [Haloarcula hispanica N601]|uniref:Glycine cleavage system protein T n=2 Tax=Haloarcula hispanica TaxID=51589 RepID=V5TUD7_HALHI|nr:FAD-dependent oxidoreductase [Haloarcula hispanica]AEM59329.1 sacrosine dehydrogenase/glycine cleavage T protein [Haloarcula hispanica ATCC 33960]AHB68184.1 glycine cleavage system protein T [Haloarcula hispanica N601]
MSTETPPSRADTVVIGAGAVGCSVAYHLTELGAEDVAVIDQGPLPVTGGSSVHAPGIMFQTSPSKIQTKTAYYTSRLLSDADVYDEVGGIEVARSEERMDFLRRRVEWATSYGLPEPQLLSPEEVTEHLPMVDEDEILGGYYSPTDGRVDGIGALQWYMENSSASFYGNTEVTDLDVSGGEINAVETDQGRIDCERAVIATNNWGYQTGQLAGLDLPIAPVEHQYVVTEPMDELADAESSVGDNTTGLDVPGDRSIAEYMSEGPHQPVGRDQDHSLYFRTHGDALGMGSYNHETLSVDPEAMGKNSEEHQASVRGFTKEHWETPTHRGRDKSAKQAFDELLPATQDVEYEATENGIFVFTPDGMPAVGETAQVDGLWTGLAIWWTHSGGYGRILAEWMENGVPRLPSGPVDTGGIHVRRFEPHAGEKDYFVDRGAKRYEQVYSIVEPRWQPDDHRGLRTSPFYHQQKELGAEFYQSGGWETPQWYESNADLVEKYDDRIPAQDGWQGINRSKIEAAEHLHTRDKVSMFDMTTFSSIMVEGEGSQAFLQRVCSNDMDLDVGQVRYSLLLNEGGGILADITVVKLDDEEFMVTTGGGNSPGIHGGHLEDEAPETVSVHVEEGAKSTIGLWGPNSRLLLQRCTDTDVTNEGFPYFSAKQMYVDDVPVIALRVSYVGELGWELWVPTEYGQRLWETLQDAGEDLGVRPMGGGALSSMRLEKGYRLWGTDIDTDSNPFEAGLPFAVDMDTDFIGKEALEAARKAGIDSKITPVTLDDSTDIMLSGRPVLKDGEAIGYVQAGNYGYSIDESIAYTYVPTEYAEAGTSVQIQCEGETYDATVRDEPLFDPARERITR